MKRLFLMPAFILGILFSLPAQDAEVWNTVEACFSAIQDYDADAFADNFTIDATLIAPFGQLMRGRSEIRETHKKVFQDWGGTPPANPVDEQSNKKIEYLNQGLALVTFINTSKGDKARGEGKMSYTVLLKKQMDDWLVHAVQMTPILPMKEKPSN